MDREQAVAQLRDDLNGTFRFEEEKGCAWYAMLMNDVYRIADDTKPVAERFQGFWEDFQHLRETLAKDKYENLMRLEKFSVKRKEYLFKSEFIPAVQKKPWHEKYAFLIAIITSVVTAIAANFMLNR